MKENPIILQCDMDGVFCDFAKGFYELAKQTDIELFNALEPFGTQKQYYCHHHITDKKIWDRGEELANHPDIFDMLKPYNHSIEGMHLLGEMCEERNFGIFICTAPHMSNKRSYSAKAEWIERYLGRKWLDKTLMVRDKTIINGTILIDDKPEPLGNFKPSWAHVVMPHSYNVEQQKHNYVFKGWDKDSLNELLNYAEYVNYHNYS